ncbi:unnamed protein product [Mytilus edulis]|uniref:Uncharacterized protein n=1 Tax=Mytilus edulis TaxID=6550 RepID=A0A8S3UQ71_MYTED|nr:unnamed protein product [Mytilus edulis]
MKARVQIPEVYDENNNHDTSDHVVDDEVAYPPAKNKKTVDKDGDNVFKAATQANYRFKDNVDTSVDDTLAKTFSLNSFTDMFYGDNVHQKSKEIQDMNRLLLVLALVVVDTEVVVAVVTVVQASIKMIKVVPKTRERFQVFEEVNYAKQLSLAGVSDIKTFTVGRLKNYVENWQNITDKFILDSVEHCHLELIDSSIPTQSLTPYHRFFYKGQEKL